jgi:tetratricopeptide (TPR) repeat protein
VKLQWQAIQRQRRTIGGSGERKKMTRRYDTLLRMLDDVETTARNRQAGRPLAPAPSSEPEREPKCSPSPKAGEAEAAYNRGLRLVNRHLLPEAIPHFREALSLSKLPEFYQALGIVYLQLDDPDAAEQLFKEGLEFAQGTEDRQGAAVMRNLLGQARLKNGDLEGALCCMMQALETDLAVRGPEHPAVALDASNLGQILQEMGDLELALRCTLWALRVDESNYGPDHPSVAVRSNNIGQILLVQGDLAGAHDYTLRALNIDQRTFGADHPAVAQDAYNLSQILLARGDLDEALRYAKWAQRIDEDWGDCCLSRRALRVSRAMQVGRILFAMGDPDGEKRQTQRALQIYQEK